MAQFDVHRNRNAATRARFPLLLNIQSDLLESLATCVVVPLAPMTSGRKAIATLTPTLRVEGKDYVALVPQLAGISTRELGPVAGNVAAERGAIVAAIDLLITGI